MTKPPEDKPYKPSKTLIIEQPKKPGNRDIKPSEEDPRHEPPSTGERIRRKF